MTASVIAILFDIHIPSMIYRGGCMDMRCHDCRVQDHIFTAIICMVKQGSLGTLIFVCDKYVQAK